MSFRPDTSAPPIQDMPPPGGFPAVDIKRTARARGPSGGTIWAVASLSIAYGMYRLGQQNRERATEMFEERKSRYAVAPILQAEEDKWYAEREADITAKEAEIMKNVSGWKAGESVYHSTNRWVPRPVMPLNKNLKK
mmetsp:Transcript_24950/g.63688  ORF Transcript_24950/g.63688 Transcript_24950/m.63688 type:complete len:137 (+) Transcript_24950:57-467(+)